MNVPADPRAVRSREAILVAARRLLLSEGPTAITHQRVAQQAGVGRATVYRHWSGSEQLLLDVMAGVDMPFFREPETPVRAWLHRELRKLADELALPEVTAVALTLMQGAMWDQQILLQRDHFIRTINERIDAALALAVANREIDTPIDPTDVPAMLIGPILYRTTMQAGAVSEDLIDRLIDSIGKWSSLPSTDHPHSS
jgi:AcrR family transcriptional regulator